MAPSSPVTILLGGVVAVLEKKKRNVGSSPGSSQRTHVFIWGLSCLVCKMRAFEANHARQSHRALLGTLGLLLASSSVRLPITLNLEPPHGVLIYKDSH